MASPSCASTLPHTSAFSSPSSASSRRLQKIRASSLLIFAQGKVKKYCQGNATGVGENRGRKEKHCILLKAQQEIKSQFNLSILMPGKVKEEAQQLARVFQTIGAFKVPRKGEKGKQIFGSVTSQDLVDIIKSQLNRDVDKRLVEVPEIREVGEYVAEIKLHPDVTARVG